MSRLQRHPLSLTARFRDALVLTYALPEAALRPFVPPTLGLERRDGLGFLAVALVDMEELRPSGLPPWIGSKAVFVGYRVFVRAELASGRVRRGLKVVRTDVDRMHLLLGTRLLTRYRAGLVSVRWQRDGVAQRVRIRSRWRGADLVADIELGRPPQPPPGSPFASWSEAEPFAGPLPWTFAPDDIGSSAIAVKGVRSAWRPEPVTVRSHTIGFLSAPPFAAYAPVLASAFHVADVAYSWRAGQREALRPPQANRE